MIAPLRVLSADDIKSVMTWDIAINAIRQGHLGIRPTLQDMYLERDAHSIFARGVILSGHGAGVKIASIYPPNLDRLDPLPVEHALFAVIDDSRKQISWILDGPELTRWKTAADSALAASILSPPESRTLLSLGSGPIALALAEAHLHVRPSITRVMLWNRTPSKLLEIANKLALSRIDVEIVLDLERAIPQADIVSSATGSNEPLILGRLIKESCHVDLVGGFRPDMRESDDRLIGRASIYVDNAETAIEQCGDICVPLATGVIQRSDIAGDLFDLVQPVRVLQKKGLTVFKNAGGAHLDLLVALAVVRAQRSANDLMQI